jgi:hypothetical protein
MTRKPSAGKCAHCLKYFENLTWDHVFPKSWFPVEIDDIEKWIVPSCAECNKRLGRVEENLLLKFGLALDPWDNSAKGIPDKALRSLNPKLGRNDRDRGHRQARKEKLLRELITLKELPEHGVFPNLGPLPNHIDEEYHAIQLDENEIYAFAEKIIRGIAYITDKSYIDEYYKIEPIVIEEKKETEFRRILGDDFSNLYQKPGFEVKRFLVEDEKITGIYRIKIWGRIMIYVIVQPKSSIN